MQLSVVRIGTTSDADSSGIADASRFHGVKAEVIERPEEDKIQQLLEGLPPDQLRKIIDQAMKKRTK